MATLKLFFCPKTIKAILITAAILVISIVVIVNWDKIKPVFNNIVNVFVEGAKAFASTIVTVFNRIFNTALSSTISEGKDAAFTNDIIKDMSKYGLTKAIITSLIKEFTKIDLNTDNNNKTIYLGTTEDKYNEIAEGDENGISFHVKDDRWYELLKKYSQEGLWLVNKAFLQYVVYKKWDIILVTNPNNYYNLITRQRLSTRMYARELEFLANLGASWHAEIIYWRVDKAW